jgi:hypothetical protein
MVHQAGRRRPVTWLFARRGGILAALLMLLTSSAHADWLRIGSEPASGRPRARPFASYRIPECRLVDDGSVIAGPTDQTYHLASGPRGGVVLYELNATDKGAMITNHWSDVRGDHFLNYINGKPAWEFVIPQDRFAQAVRLVYQPGEYSVSPGSYPHLVSGTPVATCNMVRTDIVVPPAPAGNIPQPAPASIAPPPTPAPMFVPAPARAPAPTSYPGPATTPASAPVRSAAPQPSVPPATGLGGLCDRDSDCKGQRICVDHHCAWPAPAPSQGCIKDTDCPGDEICVSLQCQAPARKTKKRAP